MSRPIAQPEDIDHRLVALEAAIAENINPIELARQADELQAEIGEDLSHRLRYLIVRATVDNRLALSERAFTGLMEARRLSVAPEGLVFRSTISRMLATLHAWRGRGNAAATELLRAAAEAAAAGSGADFAATLAEAARAAQETHRFDLALIFLDAALASADLAPTECIRAKINRLQCLNRLGKYEECLKEVECTAKASAGWNTRRRLLRALEHARALAATGASEAAVKVLDGARDLLPPESDAFEHLEWQQASIEVRALDDSAEGIRTLRGLISGYADSDLYLREADARLMLGDLLRQTGDATGALDEASRALRIATAEHSMLVAERARSAILRSGQQQDIADTAMIQLSQRYMLADTLGRGGYGLVRRAIDMETGAERAVKLIALDSVADLAARKRLLTDARAEIEAASRLLHPGVVRIHSAFVSEGSIVIVQDLVRGRPLALLRDTGMSEERILDIFARLAHALVAIHEEGIVHRDLKPSNVMIDEMERPVIIDLGLATLAGQVDGNDEANVRGTLGYIAPEMLSSGSTPRPDPRQDIYAFGRMLDEFLPATRITGMWGRLGLSKTDPLENLRRAMIARNPGARPASLRAVAIELDRRLLH